MKLKMVLPLLSFLIVASAIQPAIAQPPSGMVSYWKFDEGSGTTAYDSVGTNDGTLVNGPVWTTGIVDGALSFDGANDYVEVPESPSLAIAGAITIEAWVYVSSAPTNMRIECKPYSTEEWVTPSADYQLVILNEAGWGGYPGRAVFFGLTLDGSLTSFATTDTVPLNTWTHLAATYDGYYMKIYIDGQERASKSASGTIGTSGNPLFIGTRTPVPNEVFDGVIDEVAIYNRTLTAEEISQHYQNGLMGLGYYVEDPVVLLGDLKAEIDVLPDEDFRKPADNRRSVLLKKIDIVIKQIGEGEYTEAAAKLDNDIKEKLDCDGEGDWLVLDPTDSKVKDMVNKIDLTIAILETL